MVKVSNRCRKSAVREGSAAEMCRRAHQERYIQILVSISSGVFARAEPRAMTQYRLVPIERFSHRGLTRASLCISAETQPHKHGVVCTRCFCYERHDFVVIFTTKPHLATSLSYYIESRRYVCFFASV